MEAWQNPQTLALWILIIFLFVALLAGSLAALVNANFNRIIRAKLEESRLKLEHQQELLSVSLDAGEKEKQHIASELHDHFGVGLSTLKLWITEFHRTAGDKHDQYFSKITSLIDKNIGDVRDLSHEIYPPLLREWGLGAALSEVAADLREQLKIDIRIPEESAAFDYRTSLQLFRICQEFIQNSLKYAQAGRLEIRLRISGPRFSMLLTDNGSGFDPAAVSGKGGLGIRNMLARSQVIGARCRIRSKPGKGTTFVLLKELT